MRIYPLSKTSIQVTSATFDWNQGDVFFSTVTANQTYNHTNMANGRVVTFAVQNGSASPVTITFSPLSIVDSAASFVISANRYSVFTFVRANGSTYLSIVKDLA